MDPVSAVNNVDLSNQVSVLVAKKAMDSENKQGQVLVDMISQAMPPSHNEAGPGHVDLYA